MVFIKSLSPILDKRVAEFMEQGLSKEEAEAKAIDLINKLLDIINIRAYL